MKKREVCREVFEKLMCNLPSYWDGKECILYMKENGCTHWRQMEWFGFYFQFMCETILGEKGYMKVPGVKYGNVEFDGFKLIPWDFKAHTLNGSSPNKVPTNGYLEIKEAIEEYGCVGFIIASGNANFDDEEQSFKKWHDYLKGKISKYEKSRIARGALSRRRKASFKLESIRFVFVDKDTFKYCKTFQTGMRNSNGKPRKSKIEIDISDPRLEQYIFQI